MGAALSHLQAQSPDCLHMALQTADRIGNAMSQDIASFRCCFCQILLLNTTSRKGGLSLDYFLVRISHDLILQNVTAQPTADSTLNSVSALPGHAASKSNATAQSQVSPVSLCGV